VVKRVVVGFLTALVALAGVLVARTAALAPAAAPSQALPALTVDAQRAAEHLAGALRFETVTTQGATTAPVGAFLALHRYLAETFPRAHQVLAREVVGASLLYTWRGQDPKLRPVVLMAHLDVVPVEAGTESQWTHPPFAGVIADGYVWGRGAMDDKVGVVAILEAVEALVAEGLAPQRTVFLAFGDDEEAGAGPDRNGAARMASLLKQRGVDPELVLDEGGALIQGMVPGLDRPLAMVGIAEKGYLSLELSVKATGGHSSMPPPQTAIGILSHALSRLEDHPMPVRLAGPTRQMLLAVASELRFGQRLVLANLWLFGPLVERLMLADPAGAATVRTTTAATVIRGGDKENVLPQRAQAVVNFRILPGDSVAGVGEHVRHTVADARVEVQARDGGQEPSGVSATDSTGYRLVERTIRQLHPTAVVAPNLVVGATDARFYSRWSRNVYRFEPLQLQAEDLKRVHGTDERVDVAGYANAVRFYAALLRQACAMKEAS
jgi:carboxypeptidase PM20D1